MSWNEINDAQSGGNVLGYYPDAVAQAFTPQSAVLSGTAPVLKYGQYTWSVSADSAPVDQLSNGQVARVVTTNPDGYEITWPSVIWAGAVPDLTDTPTLITFMKVNGIMYGAWARTANLNQSGKLSGTTPALVYGQWSWRVPGNSAPTLALNDGQAAQIRISNPTGYTVTLPEISWIGPAPVITSARTEMIVLFNIEDTVYGYWPGADVEDTAALSGATPRLVAGIHAWTLTSAATPVDGLENGQSMTLHLNPSTYGVTWPTSTVVGTFPALGASVVNIVVLWKLGGVLYRKHCGVAS